MNYKERVEKKYNLLHDFIALEKERTPTQFEKDLFNLQYMIYDIDPDSLWGRTGMISTLKRAIKLLKKEMEENQ